MDRAGILTPVGPVSVTVANGCIASVGWMAAPAPVADGLAARALAQIAAWFAGERQMFDLPLAPATGFMADMRAVMCAIPFGETRSYGQLARLLGVSAQAVGRGCGANPLPLIVPCHRVLGANGLGGYSGRGGVDTKVALLRHEGAGSLLI